MLPFSGQIPLHFRVRGKPGFDRLGQLYRVSQDFAGRILADAIIQKENLRASQFGGLQSLCDNSKSVTSAAKAALILRQLGHG
jgi:hypothetical protein